VIQSAGSPRNDQVCLRSSECRRRLHPVLIIAFSNGDKVGADRGGTNSRKLLARRVRRYCDS